MATQVSPGIRITEVDNTLTLSQVALTEGAIAGNFQWGPVDKVVTIGSEESLVKTFGKPDSNSADAFFTAASFLAYSNSLRTVRVVNSAAAFAATGAANGTQLTTSATFTTNVTANLIVAASGNASALIPGMTVDLANSSSGTITLTVLATINSIAVSTVAVPSAAVTAGNVYAYGVYVKNEDHYDESFADGTGDVGPVVAKHVGVLGNSLRVEICSGANAYSQTPSQTLTVASGNVVTISANIATILQVGDVITANGERRSVTALATNGTELSINTAFSTALTTKTFVREWKYASLFYGAPGTSDWATQRGGSADELHVVVIDEDGAFSGTANSVLEKFSHLSKAVDAKKESGGSNYYATVLNRQSAYVWWFDHPTGGTYWGNNAAGTTFAKIALISGYSLKGGVAGGTLVAADLYRGYDLLADESIEASLILGASANSTVASYIINSVVLPKKFSIGFFSPDRDTVVDNAGDEVDDIVTYRDALPSTSFAVLDSGWKYTYDKYNDVFRYVPLNGDVAGCCVRTDQVAESWFSPAGFTRGAIKNVVKLAFNPTLAQRDDLYRRGINPVVSYPGQGTILFGDKTLLTKPSAFDRINVRRLFIAIEKTVEKSAKQQLFEQNDSFTRAAFINMVEPFLRSVKGRRGVSDYFVVCDETNNPADAIGRNEFRADVYVKPIHSINFISLNFVVVRSDVAFTEVVTNLG